MFDADGVVIKSERGYWEFEMMNEMINEWRTDRLYDAFFLH